QGDEQPLLAVEVVVDHGRVDAGDGSHLAHGDLFVFLGLQALLRGAQQGIANLPVGFVLGAAPPLGICPDFAHRCLDTVLDLLEPVYAPVTAAAAAVTKAERPDGGAAAASLRPRPGPLQGAKRFTANTRLWASARPPCLSPPVQ